MGRASSRKRDRRERVSALKREAARSELAGRSRGCLICRRDVGGFRSREHPLPESLGNTTIVLPAGVVCDRCNNGPLSVLDQIVCDFLPVKMRRTMLGVRSKAGSVPATRFRDGSVEQVGPASLRVTTDSGRVIRETFRTGNTVGLRLDVRGGRRMTPRYGSELSRALLKMGLELAWIDHGSAMLDARFDHIRDAILGAPWSGFVVMGRKGDPDDTRVSTTYGLVEDTPGNCRMWVVGEIFGITLATDSRLPRPPVDVDHAAMVVSFGPQDFKAA